MKYAIGIDIGGMSIKVGLVDGDGNILCENRIQTADNSNDCIANMVVQINEVLSKQNLNSSQIQGIGIGCPGAVSQTRA